MRNSQYEGRGMAADNKQKEDKDKTPAELIAERDEAIASAKAEAERADKNAEVAEAEREKTAKAKRGEEVDIFAKDYDGPMTGQIAGARHKHFAEQAAAKAEKKDNSKK